ncbi:MAG: hypothetical protein U0Z75_02035 [Deinococcaceae bacterium]
MKIALMMIGLATLGLAQAQKPLPVYLENQKLAESTITVGGKTYVPLSLLNRLGFNYELNMSGLYLRKTANSAFNTATTQTQMAQGGTNQRASVEGCMGESLFNGVWRFKVNKIETLGKTDMNRGAAAWRVYVQLINGTNRSLVPYHGGIERTNNQYLPGLTLAVSDGSIAQFKNDSAVDDVVSGSTLPPGAFLNLQPIFIWGSENDNAEGIKPTKLLFEMRPDLLAKSAKEEKDAKGLQFTTSSPSFRVNLTCQK